MNHINCFMWDVITDISDCLRKLPLKFVIYIQKSVMLLHIYALAGERDMATHDTFSKWSG